MSQDHTDKIIYLILVILLYILNSLPITHSLVMPGEPGVAVVTASVEAPAVVVPGATVTVVVAVVVVDPVAIVPGVVITTSVVVAAADVDTPAVVVPGIMNQHVIFTYSKITFNEYGLRTNIYYPKCRHQNRMHTVVMYHNKTWKRTILTRKSYLQTLLVNKLVS